MIIIIHTNRKSLLSHLDKYFKEFCKDEVKIVKFNSAEDIKKYKNEIGENKIKYFVFSNGTDKIDQALKIEILKLNPNQKLIFSENAWFTWQDFLYLDFYGIANNSDIYSMRHIDLPNITIPKNLNLLVYNCVKKRLSIGEKCPYSNYVMVPLPVNNDSKLIIGSPYFSKVEEFVDYLIDVIPNNIKILFKNHPENKKKILIPNLPNVIDITNSGYSKESLIKNSLFVAGINSTFLMESIFMRHKTISFGVDLFSNKDITIDGYGKTFNELLESLIDINKCDKFIQLLISRQIPKFHILEQYKKSINNENFIAPCCSI